LGGERPPERPAVNRRADIQVLMLIIVGGQNRPEIIQAADLLEKSIPVHGRSSSSLTQPTGPTRRDEFNQVVLKFLDGLRV
jgi:hypothetical protein